MLDDLGVGEHVGQFVIAGERGEYFDQGRASARLAMDASVLVSAYSAARNVIAGRVPGKNDAAGSVLESGAGEARVANPLEGGAANSAAADAGFIGPRIGNSGYITAEELAQASFLKYQGFVDDAYSMAKAREAQGLLRGNPNTRIGDFVDRESGVCQDFCVLSHTLPPGQGRTYGEEEPRAVLGRTA